MAATKPLPPRIDTFNFHALRGMDPHRAAIRLEIVEPATAIRGTLPLDIGRLESDLSNFRIQAVLNAGRIGLPAAELRFQLSARAGSCITELRIAFEPGVQARSAPFRDCYNLQEFSANFQGKPGGGGNTYSHDHPDLRFEKDIPKKKRTLKIKTTTHGFVPYPDAFAVNAVLNDDRTPAAARDFIQMLLDAKTVKMTWYCIINPGLQARVQREVLDPFQSVFSQRQPPLYQYDPVRNILTLDMQSYEDFRGKMYCSEDRSIAGGFSQPRHQLPDMQSRPAVHTVANTHTIGHIREHHGQERIIRNICSTVQDMRLVRSLFPILASSTVTTARFDNAMFWPSDAHMYAGYVNSALGVTQDHDAPPIGARFQVFWQKAKESAYAIVLDVSPSVLQAKNAAFIMALFKVPSKVKERAATSLAGSKRESVKLVSVPNRLVAQIQLEALHRYAKVSNEPTVSSLRILSTYRENVVKIPSRHVVGDATVWGRALTETKSNQLQSKALSQGANNMLTQLVQSLDGYIELLETPLQGSRIDACLALIWQLLATGSTVLLVSDFVDSRANMCSRIWNMRSRAINAPEFGKVWGSKLLLAYTSSIMSHDGNSAAAVKIRNGIDLSSRFLDDLPRHEWLTDETGMHGQSPSIPQQGGVPPAMSMGSAISGFLSSTSSTPQHRQQYFWDRKQEIDDTRSGVVDVGAILSRRNELELQILRSVHLLVTNSATAVSENVRTSMQNAVVIYMDTQSVPFFTVASTIASYPNAREVFVCGNSADNRHPLRWYARNQSEARRTTVHGAWKTFLRAGNVPHSLA